MRHLRLLALLVPGLLLPAACEDPSSSSSGGLFNPEAGPGFEAGSPSEAGSLPDAGPPPDAGADQFVPPKGVTVTVTEGLMPKQDVRVLSHDATGAVTGDVKTDATGKVTLVAAPSMITVLASRFFAGTTPTPVTFAGVADGDSLVVTAAAASLGEPVSLGTFAVSFPQGGVPGVTDDVFVESGPGCSAFTTGPASPANVSLYSECLLTPNVVLATASTGGIVKGFGFDKNVAKPALNGTTNVGPLVFSAPGATKVTAANLPASTFSSARLYGAANGGVFSLGPFPSGSLDDGGITFPTPTGFASAYQTAVSAQSTALGPSRTRAFLRREATTAPASATLAFDFASALPEITDATITKLAPARPDVALTTAASLASADGAVAVLAWTTLGDSTGEWTFVMPPSTTAFKAPALPADATAFVPTADARVDSVTFFEATQLPGYKELKALPVTPSLGVGVTSEGRLLPAAGTVRLTRILPGGGQG